MKASIPAEIAEQIRSIASLPISVQQLLAASNDLEADVRELTKIIEQDQALTARILRISNSSFYGLPRHVDTISKAVVILGFQAVRTIALQVALLGLKRKLSDTLRQYQEGLWQHAVAVASAADLLARRLHLPDPEVALVSGLLHDLGKTILLEVFGERYTRLLDQDEGSRVPLHVREQEAFGVTHMAAGLALCEHWNLPDLLTRAVAVHHDPPLREGAAPQDDFLISLVQIANALAKIAQVGSSGNAYVELCAFGAARPGLKPDALRAVLETLPIKARSIVADFLDEEPDAPLQEAYPAEAALVGIYLEKPGVQDMVTLVLHQQGCGVVAVEEQVPPGSRLLGIIADDSLPDALRTRYLQQGLLLHQLDFWPSEQEVGPRLSINMKRLQQWISYATRNSLSAP